ncbi:MAG: hypothetical protein U9Q69_04725 [Nanoarchaeota archaeon]|nr:hypothetical protein [Nanoarchaeota archaeon]
MRDYINPEIPIIFSDELYQKKKRLNHLLPERKGAWAVFRFIHKNFSEVFEYHAFSSKDEATDYLAYRFDFDPHVKRMDENELQRVFSAIVAYDSIVKENYSSNWILFNLLNKKIND